MADAVSLIMDDHRVLEGLFERLRSGADEATGTDPEALAGRRALVEEVAARLTAHARAEEREVYPALIKADPAEDDDVDHAYHEHHEAEHLLGKVTNLVESPHFGHALTDFIEAVRHHVAEEEAEVLPALANAVDAATLERLGAAFERVRKAELAEAGYEVDAVVGGKPAPRDGDLADATRDELYEMAKQADVSGRSRMTKQELAEALRKN
jgi:hemerythrin superfamily protein